MIDASRKRRYRSSKGPVGQRHRDRPDRVVSQVRDQRVHEFIDGDEPIPMVLGEVDDLRQDVERLLDSVVKEDDSSV